MRLLINANVFGWRMTGLLPKGARWFFGFATRTTESEHKIYVLQRQVAQLLDERDALKDGYWEAVGCCAADQSEISALLEALRSLEDATDAICALRTTEQYLSLIDAGQKDALARLDEARRVARSLIAPHAPHDGSASGDD